MERHLLLLSYYYPPCPTVASIRPTALANNLLPYFSSITVLTADIASDNRVNSSLEDPSIAVIKTKPYDLKSFFNGVINFERSHGSKNRKLSIISRIFRSMPLALVLGEGGLWYIFNQYFRGIKLIMQGEKTHLFSTYGPWSSVIVAFLLKLRFPKLIWISDWRDIPFDRNIYAPAFPGLQRIFFKWFSKSADLITVVSQGQLPEVRKLKKPARVIFNGIEHFRKPESNKQRTHFEILYAGSYYKEMADGDCFFKALSKTLSVLPENTQLTYMGKNFGDWSEKVEKYQLQKISEIKGDLSLEKARENISMAGVLLVFSWSRKGSRGILSRKLIDYLSTGIPIIMVVEGASDSFLSDFFKKYNPGLLVFSQGPNTIKKLSNYLVHLSKKWEAFGHTTADIPLQRKELLWSHQCGELMRYIKIIEFKRKTAIKS